MLKLFLFISCLCLSQSLLRLRSNVRYTQTFSATKYSLSESYDVKSFLDQVKEDLIYGVYAISDETGSLKYVGSSEDIAADLGQYLKQHESSVKTVRIQTFALSNPASMIEAYKNELIKLSNPPGNALDEDAWTLQSAPRSKSEHSQMVSQKSAMDGVETEFETLRAAIVENGKQNSSAEPILSPFQDGVESETGVVVSMSTPDEELEFNIENINKVLDEIRPYLIADGGNVAVASIDPIRRDVFLSLQGACGSCPSSTTTMKMGIERVLKENFSDLGEVAAVSPEAELSGSETEPSLSTAVVLDALTAVLPAVKAMGGRVEIWNVDASSGEVVMKYSGPAKLRQGIELVVKDLKLVKTVNIIGFD